MLVNCFFQGFHIENRLYSYGFFECNIVTYVQNKSKISPTVLPVSLAEHLQTSKEMCFICNDKRISDNNANKEGGINDNNTNKEGGIGRREMNCAKKHLTE